MAVARVKKIELIAHHSDGEKILKVLEEAAILQVIVKQEIVAPEKVESRLKQTAEQTHELLSKTNFLLNLLRHYYKPSTNLIDSFIPPKLAAKKSDYEKVLQTLPLEKLYQKMERVDVEIRHLETDIAESSTNLLLLEPWSKLDFDPSHSETNSSRVFLGTISSTKESDFLAELEANLPLAVSQVANRADNQTFLALFIYKDDGNQFFELAKQNEFSLTQLPSIKGTVSDNIKALKNQINVWKEQKLVLVDKIQELGRFQNKLTLSQTFLRNQLNKLEIQQNILHTEYVFALEGWIKAADSQDFKNMVAKATTSYALNIADPAPDEEPPVILENPRWLKPLEAVTALYGMPTYKEIDPTPYMAPFFLIFFGLAIGDVVYGAALALISWALTRSTRFKANTKVFLRLFIYGGVSAIFFGVITGSWLALDQSALPTFIQKLIIFHPLSQPALFLVITLLLGLVQIYFGLIINLFEIAKEESVSKALQAQLPRMMLLPGATLLIAKLLGSELSPALNSIAVYLTVLGAVGIVLFSETEAKSLLGRLGGGLYNLYGMTSYLGDTISYGRIMALGLATFLIGSAINTIILGGAIIQSLLIKVLLTVTILPVVHLLNLAINTIGAFVHPARLQYVEFFSKFFEGGGKRFKPLAIKTDNINLVDR